MELIRDGRNKVGIMGQCIEALVRGDDGINATAGAVFIADGIHALIALQAQTQGKRKR
jgi:hypothetical protein